MDYDKENRLDRDQNHIGRLSEFEDYEVADHDPDVRGWDVIGADGTKCGQVEDLIVDRQEMRTRYLEIDLSDDLIPDKDDRHLLVPIGMASLDDDQDRVYLGDLDRAAIARIPPYDGGPITREYEQSVRNTLRVNQPHAAARSTVAPEPAAGTPTVVVAEARGESRVKDEFYNLECYDEETFYGNRRKAGPKNRMPRR